MTDTLTDDEILHTRSSRPTTSTSTSSITTTTRRPIYIETELRTDTVTTRRMATAAANRSVHDALENTKSPSHDRHSTSYTYAHGNSYAPVTRSGAYDLPVTARSSPRGGQPKGLLANITSTLSSPSQLFSTVQTQLTNGYEAVKDRVFQLIGQHQGSTPGSPSRGITSGGTRFSRTSSQSSGTGSQTKGYNLRSRPVHSTPRETDTDQQSQRKPITKHRKQHGEIDEEDDENQGRLQYFWNKYVQLFKKIFHSPIDILYTIWDKLKLLPLWLLIPLLLLLGLYALPQLGCKPFERFHHAKVNEICENVHHLTNNLTKNGYNFVRRHTYERGLRNLKQVHASYSDIKDSLLNSLSDAYYSTKSSLLGGMGGVKDRFSGVVETTAENAKEYYDAGIQKVNSLIEELKQEREKILGTRHTLKPDQEKELSEMVRKLLDEYAADETGQADYALEANGGKVVDTRCQEYTDEPRQNVVKFLGIPIVHMSKQPDILIKHGRMPGQCFPFKGDHGSVVIRLAVPVVPTEFVLEHLSKSISIVGHINSAPNNFTVYALKDKHDKEGVVLGRYFYDAENGPALQRFKPQINNVPVVEYIEVQVTSNWGNPNYTCLYRFRVHGDMQTVTPTAA
jgi:SUN domain-containing protein 1/2